MTGRQAGKRISTLYTNGRSAPQRTGRRAAAPSGAERRRLTQLVICAAVFVLLVGAKLLLPSRIEPLRGRLTALMEQNMDVTGAFSAVGRAVSGTEAVSGALQDVFRAVFQPEDSDAVAVSAPAPQFGEPDPLEAMRTFVRSGDSGAWMMRSAGGEGGTAQAETADTAAASAAASTAPAAPANPSPAASASGETPRTMELSSVLYSHENLPANVSLEQAVLGFAYTVPVRGTLSSNFGYREHPVDGEEKFHYGVDLAADTGTEIDCFADGVVASVGESTSYGKYLTVTHAGGYTTLYAHCSAISVSSGTAVKRGQMLAQVGQTGIATGPHLHFELHRGSVYLDPIYYVAES